MDYASYLKLPAMLDLQAPESTAQGRPAHDEMLFIVTHQAYELWFKQVLHELDRIQSIFDAPTVAERDLLKLTAGLERILTIWRLLIQQVDVLETMTPMDFLEFRDLLFPASGFQSEQFRVIETRLGLRRDERLKFDAQDFDARLDETGRANIAQVEQRASLIDQLDAWLARTPFIEDGAYDFAEAYRGILRTMLEEERAHIRANPHLGEAEKQVQIEGLNQATARLEAILDDTRYEDLRAKGEWRLSRRALEAALFINLYRDEPALQLPFKLLSLLMDLDEALTTWRQRHAQMALRMIGRKVGTGGSSGHAYLRETAEKHRVFGDLLAIATYLIPRSRLPDLPRALRSKLAYVYQGQGV